MPTTRGMGSSDEWPRLPCTFGPRKIAQAVCRETNAMPRTLFDKIWDSHLVGQRADGRDLLYIDRHVLHELHAHHAFTQLERERRPIHRPDLTFAVQEQGISQVVAPELGIVLPGATHAVPDSHASTVGGVGALAFGCGTSEMAHILATQTMALKRPQRLLVRLEGRLAPHVGAKDVALRLI